MTSHENEEYKAFEQILSKILRNSAGSELTGIPLTTN